MPRRLNVVDPRYNALRKIRPKSHTLDGQLKSVACSRDAGFVTAATQGTLYAYRHRKLLWKYRTRGNKRVLMAQDGSLVLAITVEGLLAFTREGDSNGQPHQLWEHPTDEDIFDAILTPDGSYIRAAIGRRLVLLDGKGHRLWSKESKDFVSGVAISPDQTHFLAGMERSLQSFNLSGDLEWEHRTGGLVLGVDITPSGEFIVAASSRRPTKQVYFLNSLGQAIWSAEVGHYNGLYVADDTSQIVATSSSQVFGFSIEGESVWTFTTQDFINRVESLGSTRLTLVATGSEIKNISRLYCLDELGQALWSYRPSGLAWDVTLSDNGGLVILAAGRRIYWLDNSPFLSVEAQRLHVMCNEFLEELAPVQVDLLEPTALLEQSLKGLETGELALAYDAARKAYQRFHHLHHRYLDYRDALPKFTERIHVDAALPERLIPTIYPLYSKHSDLVEETMVVRTLELIKEKLDRFKQLTTTVRERPEEEPRSDSHAAREVMERLTLAQEGIKELRNLMTQLRSIQKQWDENLRSLEEHSRLLVMDWLTSGSISTDIMSIVTKTDRTARQLRAEVQELSQRVETITTMIESSSLSDGGAITGRLSFAPHDQGVKVKVHLTNDSEEPLPKVDVSLYMAGGALSLVDPVSGTRHLGQLGPGARAATAFDCSANKMTPTSCHCIVAYEDGRGRLNYLRLETLKTSLLETFIVPWELDEQEGDKWKRSHDDKSSDETLTFTNLVLEEAGRVVRQYLVNFHLIGGEPRPSANQDALAFNYSSNLNVKRVSYVVTITLLQTPTALEVGMVCFASTKNDSNIMLEAVSDILRQALLEKGGRLT